MDPFKRSAGSAELMDLCLAQIHESADIYISEPGRTPPHPPPPLGSHIEAKREGVGRDSQTLEMGLRDTGSGGGSAMVYL